MCHWQSRQVEASTTTSSQPANRSSRSGGPAGSAPIKPEPVQSVRWTGCRGACILHWRSPPCANLPTPCDSPKSGEPGRARGQCSRTGSSTSPTRDTITRADAASRRRRPTRPLRAAFVTRRTQPTNTPTSQLATQTPPSPTRPTDPSADHTTTGGRACAGASRARPGRWDPGRVQAHNGPRPASNPAIPTQPHTEGGEMSAFPREGKEGIS